MHYKNKWPKSVKIKGKSQMKLWQVNVNIHTGLLDNLRVSFQKDNYKSKKMRGWRKEGGGAAWKLTRESW